MVRQYLCGTCKIRGLREWWKKMSLQSWSKKRHEYRTATCLISDGVPGATMNFVEEVAPLIVARSQSFHE